MDQQPELLPDNGIPYSALNEGDRFRFLYPHHGEQQWAWLYVREEEGHRRIDQTEVQSPISENSPLRVEKVSADVPHENGMISLKP